MFPILPILILLLLGPANAERLAVEGRLPYALLAMVQPVRATVEAPIEAEVPAEDVREGDKRPLVHGDAPLSPRTQEADGFLPHAPTRAGPRVA